MLVLFFFISQKFCVFRSLIFSVFFLSSRLSRHLFFILKDLKLEKKFHIFRLLTIFLYPYWFNKSFFITFIWDIFTHWLHLSINLSILWWKKWTFIWSHWMDGKMMRRKNCTNYPFFILYISLFSIHYRHYNFTDHDAKVLLRQLFLELGKFHSKNGQMKIFLCTLFLPFFSPEH